MMRAEMGAVEEVSGPRKLKGDEYKEFMLDNEEEKKSANVPLRKAAAKKAEPTLSWRNMGKVTNKAPEADSNNQMQPPKFTSDPKDP